MKSLFSYDSPLISILNVVADALIVNLLFVVCCLPIITIGPAMTALYSVAIKWNEKETSGGIDFLRAFWKNLRTSIPLWLTILPIGLFLAFDMYLMLLNEFPVEWLLWILIVPVSFLFAYAMSQLFMVEARFKCTYKQALKNSALLAFAHPLCSLVNMSLTAFPLILFACDPALFFELGPVWFIGYYSLHGYVSAGIAKKPYERLVKQMKEAEAEQAAEKAAIEAPATETV